MAMKTAVESMAMISGGNSPLRQGAGTEFCPPKLGFVGGGGYGTVSGNLRRGLGFSIREAYMGEEAEPGEAEGGHTWARRGWALARAWGACGPALALLPPIFWLPEASGILRSSAFTSSDSENISYVTFLKPKTAENRNWHCGILSIG
jgi:hypothetical protein